MITSDCGVVCDVHPHAMRPGWIVCVHCLDVRNAIAHLETPKKHELGLIMCVECFTDYNPIARWRVFRLLCPECVADLLRARELTP